VQLNSGRRQDPGFVSRENLDRVEVASIRKLSIDFDGDSFRAEFLPGVSAGLSWTAPPATSYFMTGVVVS